MGRLLRWRHQIGNLVGRYPTVHLPLVRMYLRISGRHDGPRPVARDTELVIEGYPRCANSFAIAAFKTSQSRDVKLAHHIHAPAQVIAAAKWNVPTLVLIREPDDAVLSFSVYASHLDVRSALSDYVAFYSAIRHLGQHFIVADFSEVIEDFGAVIDRVNARFDTEFARFESTEKNKQRCFEWIDQTNRRWHSDEAEINRTVPRPTADRQKQKERLRNLLEGERCKRLRGRAKELYQFLSARS